MRDEQMDEIVKDMMNKLLLETVGTEPPINIETIIALRYPSLSGVVAATTKALQPEYTRKPFALALLAASAEYGSKTGERIPVQYSRLAARYLLMPERGFLSNVKEFDYNLHRLIKKVYTNVTVEDIAYRLVDEGECGVRKYSHNKLGGYRLPVGWNAVSGMGLDKHESDLVKATLASPHGNASVDISEERTISGWLADEDKVILLYRIV